MKPNAMYQNLETIKEESILIARHGVLVDKKFSKGLSTEEVQELEQIRTRMDELNAPFYEPIIQRLTAIHDRLVLEQSLSQTKGK